MLAPVGNHWYGKVSKYRPTNYKRGNPPLLFLSTGRNPTSSKKQLGNSMFVSTKGKRKGSYYKVNGKSFVSSQQFRVVFRLVSFL